MPRLATRQRLGQHAPRVGLHSRRKVHHRLALTLQLKTEVREPPLQRQRPLALRRVVHKLGLVPVRIRAHQVARELRPLDRCARHTKLVGEVPERPRYRTPTPTHTRLGDARFIPLGRLLINNQRERHNARQQLNPLLLHCRRRTRHPRRERKPHRPIDTGHCEGRVFHGLHQHTAPLGPPLDALIEQLPWQAVDLTQVAALGERLGVHVVCGEVVAPRDNQPREVAILARHPVQRLHARHHRHHRQQFVVAVHQELGPRAVHRHCFHRAAVLGEAAIVDDSARREESERVAVRHHIKRHRQIELISAHTQRGAGERHTLGVTRELELRSRGT